MLVATGNFVAGAPHVLSGSMAIHRQGMKLKMITSSDFFFDGSPEPAFGLHTKIPTSKDEPDLVSNMLATRFLDLPPGQIPAIGEKVDFLPEHLAIEDYETVVLWCFSVPFILGYAVLHRN